MVHESILQKFFQRKKQWMHPHHIAVLKRRPYHYLKYAGYRSEQYCDIYSKSIRITSRLLQQKGLVRDWRELIQK